ncbi:MAG: IS630 family transposase [Alphaproteobacteria bacterium]|nr:IS630 family transposase [Alphaproteobacteria bacterium]
MQHRTEKNARVKDRIKAIILSDMGWTYLKIAEALLIDDETVSRHITEYIEEKKLTLESGGSESKLDSVQSEELIKHLEDNLYTTILEICSYVEKKYKVKYTIAGMTSWMHLHRFSYKKPKETPAKANAEEQKKFIKKYTELMRNTPENEPIEFGDGVHLILATKVSYGWIRTAIEKPISTTALRTRVNMMESLNLETMDVIIDPYETIINSIAVSEHFKKLKLKYPDAPKIHLILDRDPYNTSLATQEVAKDYGITLHYLPPYIPNLNSIERLWKVMNEHVRNNKFFASAKEFRTSIMNFFKITWHTIAGDMVDRINDNFQTLKSVL